MINEVMVANGVTTAEIPEHGVDPADLEAIAHSKRYFKTKAFASFDDHGSCPRTWKSAHAWCVLDLKEQCIAHKLSQDCQSCDEKAMPEFERESVNKMADWAVDMYLKRCGRRAWAPRGQSDMFDGPDDRPPHDERRCQMCRDLGRSCWK